jgi:hypothetical protein
MRNRLLAHVCVLAIAAVAAFAACDDDDGAGDAASLGGAFQEFASTIAGAADISVATDVQKERLTDNCGELDDVLDIDGLGDFCHTLREAVEEEDQRKFDDAKRQWDGLEPRVRVELEADADVAAEEDEGAGGDEPLEGGE